MTFEEFLENKNMTEENTPNDEHILACEAYKAGYEEGRKSAAVVWHKIELDKAIEPPLKNGGRYLVLLKDGDIRSVKFWGGNIGCFFEPYSLDNIELDVIEAWAEMPEAKL